MATPAPIYLLYGPVTIYTAPGGEAAPAQITTTPAGNWAALGVTGDQKEDGVAVSYNQAMALFRGQSTGPRAFARTEEDLMVDFVIVDVNIDNLAIALNRATVTDVSADTGVPGSSYLSPWQGPGRVTPTALLLRGPSALMASGVGQWYIPYAVMVGNIKIPHTKNAPQEIPFSYQAQEDPANGGFGLFHQQSAAAA